MIWARCGHDLGKTWAWHGQEVLAWAFYHYETWEKQWFRPPHAHAFYLMISEKCLDLPPTSTYIEVPTSRPLLLAWEVGKMWVRRRRCLGGKPHFYLKWRSDDDQVDHFYEWFKRPSFVFETLHLILFTSSPSYRCRLICFCIATHALGWWLTLADRNRGRDDYSFYHQRSCKDKL